MKLVDYILTVFLLLLTCCVTYGQLDLDFETDRGFYNAPFNLELSTNDINAFIRYTTNGTAPTVSSGNFYSGPIPINTTSYIRAIAYTAYDTTKVLTHSYIFPDDVLNQPDAVTGFPTSGFQFDASVKNHPTYGPQLEDALTQIPSISLIMDLTDLNDMHSGSLEFPTSVELLFPDGTKGYQVNGGVERAGGSSFNNAKRNLRLSFKSIYGEPKFDYPIFGKEAAGDFDQIALRPGFHGCMNLGIASNRGGSNDIADQVVRNFQINMAEDAVGVHGSFMHLYINGVYWGVYNPTERGNASFGESYYGGKKENFDAIKRKEALDGDTMAWYTLNNMVDNLNMANATNYANVQEYVKVEQFADYAILTNYAPHADDHLSGKNSFVTRDRTGTDGFRFWMWDTEPALGHYWTWNVEPFGTKPYNNIFLSLLDNSDFKTLVADRLECHCFNDGALTTQNTVDEYMEVYNSTNIAMLAEAARWVTDAEYDEFINTKNRIVNQYLPGRAAATIQLYRNNNVYPNIDAVQFSQYGGAVASGYQLTLSNPNGAGTIYYTTDGSDPRASGGGISGSAQVYSGNISLPDGATEIKARVRVSGTWSAMCPRRFYTNVDYTDLVINEIMYHADDTCSLFFDELDYIEIYNNGTKTVDLTDTKFSCGIDYTFELGAEIAPGDYLILAENKDTFNLHYGFMPHGEYKGGLDNSGETLLYQDFAKNIIDSVKYNDKNPWDEAPDGKGPSLELRDPSLDNSDPLNWFRSDNLCGSPGQQNGRLCTNAATPIVINEVNYNPTLSPNTGDWVELYNPNASAVNISNWEFYDNENKYTIPSGTTLQPNEYLILAEDVALFSVAFPHLNPGQYIGNLGFNLSNGGERISLFDTNKCLSDYIIYNDKIPWDTIPDGNGPTLSLITPNSDNTLPQSWEASSNINSAYGTPGRENTPCPELTLEIPALICADFPTTLGIDSTYNNMSFNWFLSNATPFNSAVDSAAVVWNSAGTYNVQLITNYFECAKPYFQAVTVEDCNTIPNIIDDNFAINEDNSLLDNVLINDNDPDNDNLTVNTTPQSNVSNGTLILNADGTFDYTPNPNFYGTDSFTYEVCDDATVATTIQSSFSGQVASSGDDVEELSTDGSIVTSSSDLDLLEDSPDVFTAVGIRITNIVVPQGATVTGAYLEFVADEAQSVTTSMTISAEAIGNAPAIPTTAYALSSKAKTNATISWANLPAWTIGNTYQSADISSVVEELINRGDWANGNAMTFIIEGSGTRTAESFDGTAAPKLFINYEVINGVSTDVSLCDTAVVMINITSENDVPIAVNDAETTTEDLSFNSNVAANDSDVEGDNLTVNTTPISDVSNGTLTLNLNGTYSYVPNANFFGTDSFTYEICDDGNPILCTQATVTITVNSVNDAPIVQNDFLEIQEDEVVSGNVLTNSSDVENHTFGVTTTPITNVNNGTLTLNANGTYTYTPNANFFGVDSFVYEVCDNGTPVACNTASVTINIITENDTPIAVNDTETATEDMPFNGNVTTNDSDIEGHNLMVNATPITTPQNGSLTLLASGSYTYTPNPDFYGTDTFEYEICDDGSPVLCATASVGIDVTPVNDAPVPFPDTLYMLANSTIQDNILLNDSDIENDNLSAMISPMAAPINGSVIIQSNGNIDYTPNPNFVGTDSFTYEICDDGTPSMCNTETVVVIIEPDCVDIELAAWLEGAYDPTLTEMRTTLVAVRKLLPGQTPTSNLATPTPAGQPYSAAPWNYAGTEGAAWTNADYTDDETDWVLVSFRTGTAKNTEVGMTAALLMKDGSMTFPDRCALTSTVASPLYIVVEHRNHIGVMTPQPVDVIGSTLTYDFRSADSFRDQTSFGQKQLPTGEWTMFAGDADQTDFPSFDIKGTDKTIWFDNNGVFDYYFSPDFNLDGDINGQDKSLWFDNNGISSRVPK